MHWPKIALALSSSVSLIRAYDHANGVAHLPRVLGDVDCVLADTLKRSETAESAVATDEQPIVGIPYGPNKSEDNGDKRCGPEYGSCQLDDECCSAAGWCGTTEDYCEAPDCQLQFGGGCDGNEKPKGQDTSGIKRPKVGAVPYGGVGIYDCVTKGDIALTFDDGPYNYTGFLLDILAEHKAKATFFVAGNNIGKGKINDPEYPWAAIIRRMAKEGHQIASHTWSHQNFTQLSDKKFRDQIIWNEIALNDILGYFPTYMRPPYSICGDRCRSMMSDLGYHIIYFDLDTQGYLHNSPSKIQTSKDIWDKAMASSSPCRNSYLQIEHDIHWQVVHNLTGYILESLSSHGYRSVTVGECLGDSPENWYRAGSGSVPDYTFPAAVPTRTCGAATARPRDTKAPEECLDGGS